MEKMMGSVEIGKFTYLELGTRYEKRLGDIIKKNRDSEDLMDALEMAFASVGLIEFEVKESKKLGVYYTFKIVSLDGETFYYVSGCGKKKKNITLVIL